MGPAIPAGMRLSLANVVALEHNHAPVQAELAICAGHPLALANGGPHNVGHNQATLELGDLVALVGRRVRAAYQARKRGGDGTRLTQRRQHVIDVPQERLRGANQQHAARREQIAVVIEQVGGAVERYGGLSCTRPTLHNESAGQGSANHRVLLGLDGGDDVSHAPRTPGAKCGEQRALAGESLAQPGLLERVDVEHVVLDGGDDPAGGGEVATLDDARRISGGGRVEGTSSGGTPVGKQGSVLGVGQPNAANVEQLVSREVEPPKHQAILNGVELRDAVLVKRREGVPLRPVLR